MSTRPIIIGAGHNGLVAAFYLARAGLRPLVLERRSEVGGAAITREFHPGFRVSALAHACGPLHPAVVQDMQLAGHGLQVIHPETACLLPLPGGGVLRLARDAWKAAEAIARISERDAARYADFHAVLGRLGGVIAELVAQPPPAIDSPSPREIWNLLKTGRRFRALGKEDGYRLLRWAPMAVADVVEEVFESDVLRAAIAARGIVGTQFGPRSAGTMAGLLLEGARQPEHPLAPCFVRGGLGALTAALASAARAAGAEIRCDARVARIDVGEAGVRGVVLDGGESLPASLVVANTDPKQTLLGLVDPAWLEPTLLWRLRNYRANGTLAKVNVALDALPRFTGLGSGEAAEALSGRIQIGADIATIERAFDRSKYGRWSEQPWIEAVLPTMTDPDLAPAGRHVLSVYAQYAPYTLRPDSRLGANGVRVAGGAGGTDASATARDVPPPTPGESWAREKDAFTRAVLEALATAAPDLPSKVLHVETLTPPDLERDHGLSGGHIHHGEMALDQLFVMRPMLGWSQYRMPVRGLYLCGAGTHPGGGITGANGMNAAKAIVGDLQARR